MYICIYNVFTFKYVYIVYLYICTVCEYIYIYVYIYHISTYLHIYIYIYIYFYVSCILPRNYIEGCQFRIWGTGVTSIMNQCRSGATFDLRLNLALPYRFFFLPSLSPFLRMDCQRHNLELRPGPSISLSALLPLLDKIVHVSI